MPDSNPCPDCVTTLCPRCKKKESQKIASRKWRAKNPDYSSKYFRANREQKNAYTRQWRKDNPGRQSIYNQRSVAKNPAGAVASQAKWSRENKEAIRNKSARRRALKKSNGVFAISIKEIKSLYKQPCYYCGAKSQHLDHVIPISRGGVHSIGNLVPSCSSCNLNKSDRFIMEWKMSVSGAKINQTKG